MKAFLLVLLSIASSLMAQSNLEGLANIEGTWVVSGSETSYFTENFNGGYENAWFEVGTGTIDDTYATSPAPLEGSTSLYFNMSGQTGRTTNVFAAVLGTNEHYFLINFPNDSTPAANRNLIIIKTVSGTTMATLGISTTGALRVTPVGGSTIATVDTLSPGTTYHVWVRSRKGTGANAGMSVGFSTDGIRPTSGNSFASSVNGTTVADGAMITFGGDGSSNTIEYIVDKYRRTLAAEDTIGNNPL